MNKIQAIRHNNKQTLKEVASIIGCSIPAIFKYERGLRIPSPKYMKKIVEWSNGEVQPNDFYKQEEKEND